MTKYFLVVSLGIFNFQLFACDVCGGGGAGNYVGIVPNFSKNSIGIRAQHQSTLYKAHPLNTNGTSAIEGDAYFKTDAWMRYFWADRWQMQLNIPFQVHSRQESERTTTITGIGDLSIQSLYTLLNKGDSINVLHKWTWTIGGGVQLPTGKYQQRDETKAMLPALFQIGSGSYGLMVNHNLGYRFKAFGISTQYQYAFLLENELGFQRGSRTNAALLFYYWYRKNLLSVLPSVGAVVNQFNPNKNFGAPDANSGGYTLSTIAGLDIYFLNWVVQLNGYFTVLQQMNTVMPQGVWQASLGVSRFF